MYQKLAGWLSRAAIPLTSTTCMTLLNDFMKYFDIIPPSQQSNPPSFTEPLGSPLPHPPRTNYQIKPST